MKLYIWVFCAGFVTGFLGAEETFPPEAVFSYPSVWELINPLSASCVNAPQEGSEEVQECMEGELDTGVSCESGGAACGRPADFPDPQFYLPIDLQACISSHHTLSASLARDVCS